mmetsp:Transcript_26638/g.54543  ORF Transcript_26638/g.54543 Transcript_26638/m.54543 type:complete len:578 (+) Transcript_26638:31-1764(+)
MLRSTDNPDVEGQFIRDKEGRVLAIEGMILSAPWELQPSSKFPGQLFFYNTETNASAWSLDLRVFMAILVAKEQTSPELKTKFPPLPTLSMSFGTQTTTSSFQDRRTQNTSNGERVDWDASSALPVARAALFRRSVSMASSSEFSVPNNSRHRPPLKKSSSMPASSQPTAPVESRSVLKESVSPYCGSELPSVLSSGVPSRDAWAASSESASEATSELDPFPAPFRHGKPTVEVVSGLGIGAFATVVLVKPLGQSATKDNVFAMKVVSKAKQPRKKDHTRMENELAVMYYTAPSRFLERCHAVFESATDVFFVCDYLPGGDLFSHMARRIKEGKKGFTEAQCIILLAEVTLGLEHLHERGFIHRDLKLENIMLDAVGHVKIIDFGLAAELTGTEQVLSSTGSLCYMAPEMIKNGTKFGGRHTDWWALGILAFELSTGRTPWSTISDRPLIRYEIQNCQVLPPDSVSPAAGQFVVSLLKADHRLRLGTRCSNDVKKAPFFQGINWSAMNLGLTDAAFVCGPAVVRPEDGRSALEAYVRRAERNAPRSSGVVGKFGVKSPWFLGLAVVTNNPPLATSGP